MTAARGPRFSLAPVLALLAFGCSVYDAALLGSAASATASAGSTGQSGGSAGSDAGTSDGDVAGQAALNGGSLGSGGLQGQAGSTEVGGTAPSNDAGSGNDSGGAGGAPSGAAGSSAGAGGSVAGAAGASAGASGSGQTATGCAKLSIPLDDAADKAHFVITLASAADLSGAILSMRLYVRAGAGGTIFNYVQDSGSYHFLGVPAAQRQKLSGLDGWSIVTWNVGAEPPGSSSIVKTSIRNIGIEVNATPSTSWLNPTIIYIDSINVSSPTLSFAFDASSAVYPTPTNTNVAGQALWVNSGATDTTATGTTVGWQATCP